MIIINLTKIETGGKVFRCKGESELSIAEQVLLNPAYPQESTVLPPISAALGGGWKALTFRRTFSYRMN